MNTHNLLQSSSKVLLIVMILCSFITVSVNGGDKGWWSTFALEIQTVINIFRGTIDFGTFLGILLILVHAGIIALPFLRDKGYFSKLLVGFPLAYLILTGMTSIIFLILLSPFALFWVATMLTFWFGNKRTLV